jgi:hypothetical protein
MWQVSLDMPFRCSLICVMCSALSEWVLLMKPLKFFRQSVIRRKMLQVVCVCVSLQFACCIVDAEDHPECEHTCNTVLHPCVVLLSPDSVWPH